jgi:uncharacterized protein (DUF433 family)
VTADREVSKGIVVDPGRLSGAPCIAGRRISAAMVADYAVDQVGIEALRNDYDLTYEDIANARAWDRKGRPSERPA